MHPCHPCIFSTETHFYGSERVNMEFCNLYIWPKRKLTVKEGVPTTPSLRRSALPRTAWIQLYIRPTCFSIKGSDNPLYIHRRLRSIPACPHLSTARNSPATGGTCLPRLLQKIVQKLYYFTYYHYAQYQGSICINYKTVHRLLLQINYLKSKQGVILKCVSGRERVTREGGGGGEGVNIIFSCLIPTTNMRVRGDSNKLVPQRTSLT